MNENEDITKIIAKGIVRMCFANYSCNECQFNLFGGNCSFDPIPAKWAMSDEEYKEYKESMKDIAKFDKRFR